MPIHSKIINYLSGRVKELQNIGQVQHMKNRKSSMLGEVTWVPNLTAQVSLKYVNCFKTKFKRLRKQIK